MTGWLNKNSKPSKVWVLTLSGKSAGTIDDFANIVKAEEKDCPPGDGQTLASAVVALGSANSIPWPGSKDEATSMLESLKKAAEGAKSLAAGKPALQSVLDGDAVKFVTVDLKDLVDMLDSANADKLKTLGTKSGANYVVLSDADVTKIKEDLGSIVDLLMAFDETGEFTEAKATEMKTSLGSAIDAFNGAAKSYNNFDADTAEARETLKGVFGRVLSSDEAQSYADRFQNSRNKI